MPDPYYSDELVTLYHGDCRQVTDWMAADVLIVDPPYGRSNELGSRLRNADGHGHSKKRDQIAGDRDTTVRDAVLTMWGADRPMIIFGDPLITPPARSVQALVYAKPEDAGIRGAHAGFRRDVEMIYLGNKWPVGIGGRSSILRTHGRVAGPRGIATRAGHTHAKPQDVMEVLVALTDGVVADPCVGSASTLLAARALGRPSIGVEVDEAKCENAARRLSQGVLEVSQ